MTPEQLNPEPMVPIKPGAEDIAAMNDRVKRLNFLYEQDGRSNPDHKLHGLYVGLHSQYSWVPGSDEDA